jgi:hypothetical protein
VRLSELVAALSFASDLGLGQPMEHVLRSCLIALRLADRLGLDEAQRAETYWVTLLALVCTGESFELAQLFGDDVAFRSGMDHIGPSQLAQMVYVLGQAGADRPAAARMRTAAGAEVHHRLHGVEGAVGTARLQAGKLLSPELVGRLHVRLGDGSTLDLEPGQVYETPPGHDAWVVGDDPCRLLDWGGKVREHAR